MGIKTDFMLTSDLIFKAKGRQVLVKICEKLKIEHYLSPVGAKEYLLEDQDSFISDAGI